MYCLHYIHVHDPGMAEFSLVYLFIVGVFILLLSLVYDSIHAHSLQLIIMIPNLYTRLVWCACMRMHTCNTGQ